VLSWLLFIHLPAKDKQLKELTDAKDKQLKDLIDGKDRTIESILAKQWLALKEMETAYRADLKLVAEHCKSELEAVTYRFSQELNAFHELLAMRLDGLSSDLELVSDLLSREAHRQARGYLSLPRCEWDVLSGFFVAYDRNAQLGQSSSQMSATSLKAPYLDGGGHE
jgi:hypothetical protein